jgi:hypothetical protein
MAKWKEIPSPEAIVLAALEIILADAQILRWIAEGYDKEDAAMIGEPDPWLLDDAGDIGDAETWQAERIGCARCGLLHAIARIPLASNPAEVAAIIKKAGGGGSRMSDLVKRLTIKAGVMEMGEKIAWGSDTSLMREAADRIEELEAKLAKAVEIIEAYGEDEGYILRRVSNIYDELKGKTDE